MHRVVKRLLSTTRTFPSTSSRELALPVAFLSAPRWSNEPSAHWKTWISAFNDAGYSCLSIELDHTSGKLEDLESELVKEIRQSSSPFPPLLCAYGLNTFIAQTYVSSHPLSGLVLVEPPLTIQAAAKSMRTLPLEDVDEFSYEPFFPVGILCARTRAEELERHRLRTEYPDDVNLLVSADTDPLGPDGFARVKDWMDTNAL